MDEDAITGALPKAQTDSAAKPPHGEPVLIPDHTLLRCIGHGSYGEVWLARNMMGVCRAVKIVYRKSFEDERPFQRELSGIRKFEPISRSHEGFVDVLQVGINEPQGYFYYVMELGDDQTAGQKINPENYSPKTLAKELSPEGRLPFQECLQLGLALSQALAELHKHELVHRDVKPSNIIFVNGVPKLADIGLVAAVSEARSYVGTEGFIPPEGPGAPQADVYGLGKVLYEASTGKDRQEFPELPAQFEKFSDHDAFLELNEVIVHACRNEKSERYHSAWDMHADLLILANGKSVKRLRILERRLSNIKRISGIFLLVLTVVAAISYQIYRELRTAIESRQQKIGASVAYGNRAEESGDPLQALPYFAEALLLDNGDENPKNLHRLRFGSVLSQCPKLEQMWFLQGEASEADFSPSGQDVLVAERLGRAQIFSVASGQSISPPLGNGRVLGHASFSANGKWALTTSQDAPLSVWQINDGSEVLARPHPDKVLCARFSPDGSRIVTGCKDGSAWIWNLVRTNEAPLTRTQHTGPILSAQFSRDGRWVVTTSSDNTARIWDAADGHIIASFQHPTWVFYASFSPDGRTLVTACFDNKARLWDARTGARILPDLNHHGGVTSADFSPDGRFILTASLDGTARLWRSDNLQPLDFSFTLTHGAGVNHASFDRDGRRIITACVDGTVRIWNLAGGAVQPLPVRASLSRNGNQILSFTNQTLEVFDTVSSKRLSPRIVVNPSVAKARLNGNGRYIVTTSVPRPDSKEQNWLLEFLEVASGKAIAPGISVPNKFTSAILSDDGRHLVTLGGKEAQLWNLLAQTARPSALLHDEAVDGAFFSPDGRRVATRRGKEVCVWDMTTGRIAFAPLKHPTSVSHAEFSPDGARLVSCCWDDQFTKCYAQVWDAATGKPAGPQLKHGDGVLFASFSPDGARVVTASEDFAAIVWDISTGRRLTRPLRHEDWVRSAAFSPDGKWVVTASSDKTARVWNSANGDPLTPPLRHLSKLTSAKFLADGRQILTSDEKGKTRIWTLPVDDRAANDVMSLARLLSGNSVTVGQLSPPQLESLESTWRRLRSKHPLSFTTSVEETIAWHEFQADDCELRLQWFAAAFHLERLLAMRNGDQSLADRLAVAKEHLSGQ